MRFLTLLLCPLIALQPIWAHSDSPAADPADPAANVVSLHLHLIDEPGPGQPHSASAKGYVVQVTDGAGAPVVGAAVALRLPDDGATGRFANGLRAWVAYSDTAGIARFPVIQWGDSSGPLELKVTAAKGANHSALIIAQRISADNGSLSVVSVPVRTNDAAAANTSAEIHKTAPDKPENVVAKLPPPPLPPFALDNPTPSTVFQPMADIAPPTEPKPTEPAKHDQQDDAPPTPLLNISKSGSSPAPEKPHTLKPEPPAPTKEASAEPTVTITNSPTGAGSSESHKKMWILIAVGAGAGAAAMLGIMAAHSAGGAAGGGSSSSGVGIGAPTVTLGH